MSIRVQVWAAIISAGAFALLGYETCKDINVKAAADERERAEQRRKDIEKATRDDEEVRQRAAQAEKERQAAKAEREAALTVKYKAMPPWQRRAEVDRLCPIRPAADAPARTIEEILAGTCETESTKALVSAVQGTPEEKTLRDALAAASKRRDESDRQRTRAVKCCDGSLSDCRCSTVHEGCCSHHGGVCGCEP